MKDSAYDPRQKEIQKAMTKANAPELLDTLEDAESYLQVLRRDGVYIPVPLLTKIAQAIAKAKGD